MDDNTLLRRTADIERARVSVPAVGVRLAARNQALACRHGLGHADAGVGVADSDETIGIEQRAVERLVQTTDPRIAALEGTRIAIIAFDGNPLAPQILVA